MTKFIEIFSRHTNGNHSPFNPLVTTLILMLIMSPSAMGAGIYKWVDENGKIHYGSQRPEDAKAKKMKLHVPEPAAKPEPTEDDEKKVDLSDEDKASQERKAYCETERKRLKTVAKNKQIHKKDANGKVIKMSSNEREERLNKIKANISKYCK